MSGGCLGDDEHAARPFSDRLCLDMVRRSQAGVQGGKSMWAQGFRRHEVFVVSNPMPGRIWRRICANGRKMAWSTWLAAAAAPPRTISRFACSTVSCIDMKAGFSELEDRRSNVLCSLILDR